jgi:transcriptional regulator with XRE-family HTH domain
MDDNQVSRSPLGAELRTARLASKRSLRIVASSAEISAAYLQKLEAGSVKKPSPHVLERLAKSLELSYPRLMALAGDAPVPPRATASQGALDKRLASARLTEAEERAVAAFVDHLVEHRG